MLSFPGQETDIVTWWHTECMNYVCAFHISYNECNDDTLTMLTLKRLCMDFCDCQHLAVHDGEN